ncbi:ribosome small subunit-dependent GTPase A [Halovulum sp. GXIMD14793]
MTSDRSALPDLGWRNHFQAQLSLEEFETLTPMRVTHVHRTHLAAIGADGDCMLPLTHEMTEAGIAVGDWILSDGTAILRVLERTSVLNRMAAGTEPMAQLIAANVDTLFIVSSCNADFNIARLERFLALARQAGAEPVIVLTKADLSETAETYIDRTRAAIPGIEGLTLNATDPAEVVSALGPWCGRGQTVALIGSSGVGKSTLVNALTDAGQDTHGIREDDAHGRHTTTARSLHCIAGGGWLVDTPGMRAFRLLDQREGIDAVFEDLTEMVQHCRFSDCAHQTEPGCAILAAVEAGQVDPARVARWQKLLREDARHSETLAERRTRERELGKVYAGGRQRMKDKRRGWDE